MVIITGIILNKMKNFRLLLMTLILAVSCNSDDDICVSGEATPRLKMKFKESQNNKLLKLNKLIVGVDYGEGEKTVLSTTAVDSVLIPLRVDNNLYTDIFIQTEEKGPKSKIRINYTSESQYVSPACGFKKLYKDVSATLVTPNPVTSSEQIKTEIINENPTHLYLIF